MPAEVSNSTVIWGSAPEREDFIILPRVVTRFGRYDPRMGKAIQPRHILLLMNLAGRRFKDRPLEVSWRQLAADLGTRADTVRKWGAELKALGLLAWTVRVVRVRGPSGAATQRRVISFDLSPFVAVVQGAFSQRQQERASATERRNERTRPSRTVASGGQNQ
jgi:hypothetical protein